MRRKKQKMGSSAHNPFMFVSGNRLEFTWTSPPSWTEHTDSVLLETWRDKFPQLGKTDLSSEEWWEVAEKVSDESKIGFTRAQCRNRLDHLKRKFKREKTKMEAVRGGRGRASKWALFKKMDVLSGSLLSPHCSLPCEIDPGNYTLMASNEIRDSVTESDDGGGNGGKPKTGCVRGMDNEGLVLKSLADSVINLCKLYKKVESRKSRQMMELEKMKVDFTRDLEVQRRQFLVCTIAKLQDCGNETE